jgi:hypothetical protein
MLHMPGEQHWLQPFLPVSYHLEHNFLTSIMNLATFFYRHLRNPQQPNAKCKHCNRTCLLYEDPNKKDDQLIHEIRKKWEQQEKDNNNEEEQPTEEPRKEGVMPTCISH